MSLEQLPSFLVKTNHTKLMEFAEISSEEADRISQGVSQPNVSPWSFSYGYQNPRCNRFFNVLPWNHSRVKLESNGLDYINASWLKLSPRDTYIATQGPTLATIGHFWAMAFQQAESQNTDVVVIVMVTPLKEGHIRKCDQYWPGPDSDFLDLSHYVDADQLTVPHDLQVSFKNQSTWADGAITYTQLLLSLALQSKSKCVHHLHYTKWADTHVPPAVEPLLILSQRMREFLTGTEAVPIVHCSAGVGRTGTFIVIDHLMHNANSFAAASQSLKTDLINDCVRKLRDHRMLMVQTQRQYLWLYESAVTIFTKGILPKKEV